MGKVYSKRKSDCDEIVLTKAEKQLLRKIRKHPHTELARAQAFPLCQMGLIAEDCVKDDIGQLVGTGKWCVSEFYDVYVSYDRRFWLVETLRSLWLPILVSVITNLIANALREWLPQLQQWFASFL